NLGRYAEAREAVDKRLSEDPSNAWVKSVKAVVLMRKGEAREALPLIAELVRQEPESLRNLNLHAQCLRLSGDHGGAQRAYGDIERLAEAGAAGTGDLDVVAWAEYNLGELDRAAERFRALISDPLKAADARRGLGCCLLAKGDLAEGEENLRAGVRLATTTQELDELVTLELQKLQHTHTTREFSAVFARVTTDIDARRRELGARDRLLRESEPSAAQRELEQVVQPSPRAETNGTWTRIAANAGLARLHCAAGQLRDAAHLYDELRSVSHRFPEAQIAFEKAIDAISEEGRRLAKDGHYPDAIDALAAALNLERKLGRPAKLLEHLTHLGEAYWAGGNPQEALEQFGKALECTNDPDSQQARLLGRTAVVQQELGQSQDARDRLLKALTLMRADGADPAGSLAAPVRASIRNVAHFWELDAWLSGLATEPGCDPAARCDLVELRRALLSYLDEKYQLDPPSASKELPIATPIVLEVGDALVPKVNPEVDGGRFIDRDIDAMRKDIEAGTGVTVPGIHVRGNPALARDGYVIMLDEAPQAEGRVEIDYVYVTAAEGTIATLGISTDRLI